MAPPGLRRGRVPIGSLVTSLLDGDLPESRRVCDSALTRLGSRVNVFADLLQPAQYEIGELWYRGDIGVADEHRATAIVANLVEEMPPTPSQDPVPAGKRCLLGVVGPEEHILGMRQLRLALEDDGWSVIEARGEEAGKMAATAQHRQASLACLSAGYLPDIHPLRRTVAALAAVPVPVLVGGSAFNRAPNLWRRVGADGHGTDARVALVLARRLGLLSR